MTSVTSRIKQIKQPRGGYLNPSFLNRVSLSHEETLNDMAKENVSPTFVGLAVDYLARFLLTNNLFKAFEISYLGAKIINDVTKFDSLMKKIKGLDDGSIFAALQAVSYDTVYRAGEDFFIPIEKIVPNQETLQNVRIMVNRSLRFFNRYGPITAEGFTFEGGYTNTVNTGDGDFLTKDTLWDFKVSKYEPTSNQTLQLLMYYIMGKHSKKTEFKEITKIGIFNPRLNTVYSYNMNLLSNEIIKEIEESVLVY